MIKKFKKIEEVNVASLEDIAAMKLISVYGRPVRRDYIDIYYLLKIFSLEKMLSFAERKYTSFNSYYTLRALTYFEDVKERAEKRQIKVLDPNFSWEKAKDAIFQEVKKFQLAMFKKK